MLVYLQAKYVEDLKEMVRIPSVSSLPEHHGDILKAVEWLKKRLANAGLENIVALPSKGGRPVVYADWLKAGPGVQTALIYGESVGWLPACQCTWTRGSRWV